MTTPKRGAVVMVQGTASNAGKSLLVAALCRIFRQDGFKVAPFKSQNMALNSFVTSEGLEIGRAQAVQAQAAGVAPRVDMNPILLKPESDAHAQVVVRGQPRARLKAREYHRMRHELVPQIEAALERLRAEHDVVVIEGAGSPAEINLKATDIANMFVAKLADAPVLLVGDIDRGGVFASFVGTIELLDPDERARVKAFVINKFRGDASLLDSGIEFLEGRTGIETLGVVPFVSDHGIAEEDSVALAERMNRRRAGPHEVEVAVIRLPHLSNYDDFDPLEQVSGVVVRYVEDPHELEGADLVVIPGSKCTVEDLMWLRETGMAERVLERAAARRPVLGVCGGCQMLGTTIYDPGEVESAVDETDGLGLLPLVTRFEARKTLSQVRAHVANRNLLGEATGTFEQLTGYEIHMGVLELAPGGKAAFEVERTSDGQTEVHAMDGAVGGDGAVVGTMIHGVLGNAPVAHHLVRSLRQSKGLAPIAEPTASPREAAYDRLAQHVRTSLDMDRLYDIIGIEKADNT